MPTARRRTRPVVAALVTAAALAAGVSLPGAAHANAPVKPPTGTGSAPGGGPGFIMGDGQTPCDPIRHMGC